MTTLTFNALRVANVLRLNNDLYTACEEKWTTAHWLQALVGEVGELANHLKKRDRGDYDRMNTAQIAYAHKEIRHELADIQAYLDILAFKLGEDLGESTVEKFNIVSERVESTVFLMPRGSQYRVYHGGVEVAKEDSK